MPYGYITITNMHIHKHYIGRSCIELIKDVRLNSEGKVPNALWTITCTYSIDYNCFNLSKFFIKIYSTDISIVTVYLYCLWILRVLLPTLHTDQTFTGSFFFTVVPFSLTESLIEYLIAPVFWVTITLYCQCHSVPPFHSFKFTSRDFRYAPLTLLSGEVWVHTLIIIHRNLAGLFLLLTNVL